MSKELTFADPVIHDPEEEQALEEAERQPEDGIALCLSGGGYRAMIFHVGALWRLNDAGLLPELKRVSSVSGGSITAGVLAMSWSHLDFDAQGVASAFVQQVVEPVSKMASKTVDRGAVLAGVLLPGSVSGRVASRYRRVLFADRTLQDLPTDEDGPRFVFNATNLQSGVLWRFSRPYMADYKVGRVDHPAVPLATVVAASSAFPPVLSPVKLPVAADSYTAESKQWALADLQDAGSVILADGGVYDNLGLETTWKRYRTVLVSNGGSHLSPARTVHRDWIRQSIRVLMVIDSQVRRLRQRQLIGGFIRNDRNGTYWGIGSDVDGYELADPLPADPAKTAELAAIPTRLKRLSKRRQKRLVNWGYVICDTALRRWVRPDLPKPEKLPYPNEPLG
jgi:NTE family protein